MTVEKLQIANDHALIRFWRAIDAVRQAKRDLRESPLQRTLTIAEAECDAAEKEMSAARMAFLLARSGEPPTKEYCDFWYKWNR